MYGKMSEFELLPEVNVPTNGMEGGQADDGVWNVQWGLNDGRAFTKWSPHIWKIFCSENKFVMVANTPSRTVSDFSLFRANY
jgi:hypothetical protein